MTGPIQSMVLQASGGIVQGRGCDSGPIQSMVLQASGGIVQGRGM